MYWRRASVKFLETVEKKTLSKYGKIEIAQEHVYSQAVHGYQISPYMQEKMVYVAQMNCYEESGEVLEKLTGIAVNSMQIHRVANCYGNSIEHEILESQTKPQEKKSAEVKKGEVIY